MPAFINSSWALTFDEEFNGKSIDRDTWGTNWLGNPGAVTKPVNSEELAAYDPKQVSVSGGKLKLSLSETDAVANDGKTYDYRSGLVNTHDSFSQVYGYFEARIFLAGEKGDIWNWPAFWLNGENWPRDGELDIMEGLGGEAAYHYHSPKGGRGDSVKGDYTGWHVFGALWKPDKVSFYYDDKYVGEITSGIASSPQYLILNHGLGINSIESAPSKMLVDWVHVYSNAPGAEDVKPQNGYSGVGGRSESNVVVGTGGSDKLKGAAAPEFIYGVGGNDLLHASGKGDVLFGQKGNDVIVSGPGADRLHGGLGSDTFEFRSVTASEHVGGDRDCIADFNRKHDLISLKSIDADADASGAQAFDFIGSSAFSKSEGELRYKALEHGLLVEGDTNGDGLADLSIKLHGISTLGQGDFLL